MFVKIEPTGNKFREEPIVNLSGVDEIISIQIQPDEEGDVVSVNILNRDLTIKQSLLRIQGTNSIWVDDNRTRNQFG